MIPFIDVELSLILQHWGLAVLLQHWEGVTQWLIELALKISSKARERTLRHHNRRLLKGCLSKAKTRRARVSVAGARSKAHIQSGFPSKNPSLERSSEFGSE